MMTRPDQALQECIAEVRAGAKELPTGPGEDWDITDEQINVHYGRFAKIFADRWVNDQGEARWQAGKNKPKRMARYIGILARFHAEAWQSMEIRDEDLQFGLDTVSTNCKGLMAAGKISIKQMWCTEGNIATADAVPEDAATR
jgi:hypothetical protein